MCGANQRLAILYGSQTGNAEDMAKRIGLKAKELGYQVLVETMDDYQLKMLPHQRLVIFVCSTTGHGQEPENMKNLYNFIRRRDLPRDCLKGLKFATYGLGDSSYAKFNFVSKILHKRLRECGAWPLQELVAGDEQHRFGCDGVIYPKLEELWDKLNECDMAKLFTKNLVDVDNFSDRNSYRASLYSDGVGPEPRYVFTDEFRTRYEIKQAICIGNQQVTAPDHFQDTRVLRFKSKEPIYYEPGDVCTVYPENCEENIQIFLQLLNLDPKRRFKIAKKDPNYMVNYLYDFIPDGTKVEDLVRYYLDIQSVPKRSFFEHLWPFSEDPLERDKLKEFASTEGQEELYDYCIRPKRSILETLMDFPSTTKNISFESLFDLIPPIKPRSFSIASARDTHPNEVHLIVGKVRYKTSMKKPRCGLCSNYLVGMKPVDDINQDELTSSKLSYFIRKTAFKLPEDDRVPIVMIGPGLGIAPFRGFIEERSRRLSAGNPRKECTMHLYFGCRHPEKDYYFKDELEDHVRAGLLDLKVAFSRLEGSKERRYVQELLVENSQSIKHLIQQDGAIIYVAGNSKLPEELRSLFGKLLASETGDQGVQSAEIERIVNNLETTNRIQYDCW